MADPARWRELAEQFTKLRREDDDKLYACWVSSGCNTKGDQWYLSGTESGAAVAHFGWAAERAAVLLGRPTGSASLFFWLDLLKNESPRYRGGGISETYRDETSVNASETGHIGFLCLASAEQCYRLETAALETRAIPGWPDIDSPEGRRLLSRLPPRAARPAPDPKKRAREQIAYEKELLRLRGEDFLDAVVVEEPIGGLPTLNLPPPTPVREAPRTPKQGLPQQLATRAETETHRQVDRFIEKILSITGRRVIRADIWRVAGYHEATQFERFQREKGASAGSVAKFTRVLNLSPAEFLRRLALLNKAE